MSKYKVNKKVRLSVLRNDSYSVPNVKSFQKKYPQYSNHNVAIFLNNNRVKGSRDYRRTTIFDTDLCGCGGIHTLDILKALNIPQEVIDQLEFV